MTGLTAVAGSSGASGAGTPAADAAKTADAGAAFDLAAAVAGLSDVIAASGATDASATSGPVIMAGAKAKGTADATPGTPGAVVVDLALGAAENGGLAGSDRIVPRGPLATVTQVEGATGNAAATIANAKGEMLASVNPEVAAEASALDTGTTAGSEKQDSQDSDEAEAGTFLSGSVDLATLTPTPAATPAPTPAPATSLLAALMPMVATPKPLASRPEAAPSDGRAAAFMALATRTDGQSALTSPDREADEAIIGVDQSGVPSRFDTVLSSLPPAIQSRFGPDGATAAIDTTGATLADQVIDMGVGGQWIDRMATEISKLAQGAGHSRFQLSPPNLGRIQIDVWQGIDGGRVQFLAETDEAMHRLSDGQPALQTDARLAALSLQTVTVARAPDGSFDQPRDQGQQGAPRQQGDTGTQTGPQGNAQGNAQGNGQGNGQPSGGQQQNNSAGQGKASGRQDVLNDRADRADPDARPGRTDVRSDQRHIRYA